MMTHWLTTIIQGLGRPFQWWVVVAPWEQGIRVRLGKTSKLLPPGIHFRIPWLDRVYVQSTRRRTIIDTNQTATTSDGRTVTFSLATDFQIVDIRKLFDSLSSPETTIGARAVASATRFISANKREDATPIAVAKAATDGLHTHDWGIGEIESEVVSFSEARTFRLINSEYRTGVKLYDLDGDNSGLR